LGGWNHEENISTISKKTKENTWIPQKNVHEEWESHTQEAQKKRSEKTHSVSRVYTFTRLERLSRRKDIDNVLKNGEKVNSDYITVLYLYNDMDVSRLCIIVGKKFGKAHERNRFKRYIREYFRLHKGEWKKCVDLIVIPRKSLASMFENLRYRDIEVMLDELLNFLKK